MSEHICGINPNDGKQVKPEWCLYCARKRIEELERQRDEASQPKASPEIGEPLKCLVCALEKPWGIFSQTTGEAVCEDCKRKAQSRPCAQCGYSAWTASAETGEVLYCVVCDARSRHRDAAQERDEARERGAALQSQRDRLAEALRTLLSMTVDLMERDLKIHPNTIVEHAVIVKAEAALAGVNKQ